MLSPFLECKIQVGWYRRMNKYSRLRSVWAEELGVVTLLVSFVNLVKMTVQFCQTSFLLFCENIFKFVVEAQLIIDSGYQLVDSASLGMDVLPMSGGF